MSEGGGGGFEHEDIIGDRETINKRYPFNLPPKDEAALDKILEKLDKEQPTSQELFDEAPDTGRVRTAFDGRLEGIFRAVHTRYQAAEPGRDFTTLPPAEMARAVEAVVGDEAMWPVYLAAILAAELSDLESTQQQRAEKAPSTQVYRKDEHDGHRRAVLAALKMSKGQPITQGEQAAAAWVLTDKLTLLIDNPPAGSSPETNPRVWILHSLAEKVNDYPEVKSSTSKKSKKKN